MQAQLITPTGATIGRVTLPEDRPRSQPYVLCWGERVFVFCLQPLGEDAVYMEVAKVFVQDVALPADPSRFHD